MVQHAYLMMDRCCDEEDRKKWAILHSFLYADDLATLIVPFLFGDHMFMPGNFDEIHDLALISPAWKIAACKYMSCIEFRLSLHVDTVKLRAVSFPRLKYIILHKLADLRYLLTSKVDLSMVEAVELRSREVPFIGQRVDLDIWKMFFRQRRTNNRYVWLEAMYRQYYGWPRSVMHTGYFGYQFTEEMVDQAILQ